MLMVGGYNGKNRLASAEIYDPAKGAWRETGSLTMARSSHTTTLLSDGTVLVVGGSDGSRALTNAELYTP
jgi:hypothetical protein